MMKAKKEVFFKSGVSEVWKKITDLSDQSWRKDILRVDVFEQGAKFCEITKNGDKTWFDVIALQPVNRYECSLENEKIIGKFSVVLSIAADGTPEKDGTRMIFTEEVRSKNALLAPALYFYIRGAMSKYINELRFALGEKI